MKRTPVLFILLVAGMIVGQQTIGRVEVIRRTLPVEITTEMASEVSEGSNERGCSTCAMLRANAEKGIVLAIYHECSIREPYSAATEKWVISNLVKRVTVVIALDGVNLTNAQSILMASTTNRWKLESEWKKTTP